jgi:predicted nucleotidyltransferase
MATKTYKVLEAVEIDGEEVAVGSEIELTAKVAKTLGEKVEEVETSKDEVSVQLETGEVRVYSLEKHGEDFAEMAKSLVSKKPGVRKII